MNKQNEQQVARGKRVGFFIADHTRTPEIPRVTVLAGQVTTLIGVAETEGSDQVEGFGEFRGGSGTRADQALALNKRLRQIGRTARELPRDEFPGVREQFILPRSLRYQQLIDTGNAFLALIGPIKAAFVERAYPADFDEKLAEQIAAFDTATERKERGVQKRRGGTAGLSVTLKKAKEAIDELDSILSVYYRTSNPALYAVWKTAMRVHVPATSPASASSTPATQPAPALASAEAVAVNRNESAGIADVEPRANGTSGVLLG